MRKREGIRVLAAGIPDDARDRGDAALRCGDPLGGVSDMEPAGATSWCIDGSG
jgi:hypothetical protein